MAIKNPILTGDEMAVNISGQYAAVRNDGTDIIYVSANPNIVPGADGIMSIPAGASAVISLISNIVYLFGSGKATVVGTDSASNPFKTSTTSSGSAVDEQARTAISTHSGNAMIHVTTEEKASWSGKAELSDIPSMLPADGGTADMLNLPYYSGIDILAFASECTMGKTTGLRVRNSSSCPTNYGYEADNNDFFYQVFRLHDSAGWITITGYDIRSNDVFVNTLSDGAWIGWRKINDHGNADTLESHPASDFVLKSDYDVLNDRVTSLENVNR